MIQCVLVGWGSCHDVIKPVQQLDMKLVDCPKSLMSRTRSGTTRDAMRTRSNDAAVLNIWQVGCRTGRARSIPNPEDSHCGGPIFWLRQALFPRTAFVFQLLFQDLNIVVRENCYAYPDHSSTRFFLLDCNSIRCFKCSIVLKV